MLLCSDTILGGYNLVRFDTPVAVVEPGTAAAAAAAVAAAVHLTTK